MWTRFDDEFFGISWFLLVLVCFGAPIVIFSRITRCSKCVWTPNTNKCVKNRMRVTPVMSWGSFKEQENKVSEHQKTRQVDQARPDLPKGIVVDFENWVCTSRNKSQKVAGLQTVQSAVVLDANAQTPTHCSALVTHHPAMCSPNTLIYIWRNIL